MGRETELCNRLGRTLEERLLLRRVLINQWEPWQVRALSDSIFDTQRVRLS